MNLNPSTIHEVVIDGHSLTIETFLAVARFGAKVSVSEQALAQMQRSRELAEKIASEKRVAYGITTGFGDFARVAVPEEMSNTLSTNLILSHCTATGDPYSEEVVRGMMLLRANALCGGVSGVRPLLVQMMVDMLNKGVIPVVPQKGSLGASGDLAPLAHMTLPMLGKGRAVYQGVEMDGAEAMAKAGIQPVETLVYKEGLGMTNGTCAMTSVGTLAWYDSFCVAQLADVTGSMTLEALTGLLNAYDERVHLVRGHKGQLKVAKNFRLLTEGSEILSNCQNDRVQDAYSLRCIPQVHGAIRDALDYVKDKIEIELNAVTDNPLLFPDDEAVISGGNFHGEPTGFAMDILTMSLVEIGNVSDRRCFTMCDPTISYGLPLALAGEPIGLNYGYNIICCSTSALASENKTLAFPSVCDTIPTKANQEDHVSMAPWAARKAKLVIKNLEKILGIELLLASRGIWITQDQLGEFKLGKGTSIAYEKVNELIKFQNEDIYMGNQSKATIGLIESDELLNAVEVRSRVPVALGHNAQKLNGFDAN